MTLNLGCKEPDVLIVPGAHVQIEFKHLFWFVNILYLPSNLLQIIIQRRTRFNHKNTLIPNNFAKSSKHSNEEDANYRLADTT